MHKPVLLNEVLELFDPQPGQTYIDATVNGGGHARAIAERVLPNGEILGIDWDYELIEELKIKNQESGIKNILLTCDNHANLKSIVAKYNIDQVDGILIDCGFSSYHIEKSHRGFTFLKDGPLDMRYNINNELSAEKIINTWPEDAIETILREYGEERFSRIIASDIVRRRATKNFTSTGELTKLIISAIGRETKNKKIHPATKTFQALRIAVNKELDNLNDVLRHSTDILKHRGKIIVISFHSLEDRIVKKKFMAAEQKKILKIINTKPIRPTNEEIKNNPRSRSAKLRAAEKL